MLPVVLRLRSELMPYNGQVLQASPESQTTACAAYAYHVNQTWTRAVAI